MKMEKIDLRYSDIITDVIDNVNNIRMRVVKYNNKLYYHQMYNCEVVQCFELKTDK